MALDSIDFFVQLTMLHANQTKRLTKSTNTGYKDFKTIRNDPDLAPLGPQLAELVGKYDNPLAQVCVFVCACMHACSFIEKA